jgi:hypothetical protein
MNYSYEIIKDDNKKETMIIEYDNKNRSNKPEMWFLATIKFYSDMWRDNESFRRTTKWVKEKYPEIIL